METKHHSAGKTRPPAPAAIPVQHAEGRGGSGVPGAEELARVIGDLRARGDLPVATTSTADWKVRRTGGLESLPCVSVLMPKRAKRCTGHTILPEPLLSGTPIVEAGSQWKHGPQVLREAQERTASGSVSRMNSRQPETSHPTPA